MMKLNMATVDTIRILEAMFAKDAYEEEKIDKLLDDGLLSAQEAGMMLAYIKA
jgi:transcriptional regulator CtsR